jgi:MoaA/NifB/PqqE/SkfB family radical SAM enzyme
VKSQQKQTVSVDGRGRLVLPAEMAAQLGLLPGAIVLVDQEPNGLRVRRPAGHLAKIYVEPTSRCNLNCVTCMRNAWEEPLGDMSGQTYSRVLEGVRRCATPPTVFFGGLGEPLTHPDIVDMVARAKAVRAPGAPLGAPRVELITNGCLLTEDMSRALIQAGLDTLWVSLDGIRPESYGDVRLGALLPTVLENLRFFKEARRQLKVETLPPQERENYEYQEGGLDGYTEYRALPTLVPHLGIVFVAMRRNMGDLPELLRVGRALGATRFLVTNVLPYTEDLVPEILYKDLLGLSPLPTLGSQSVQFPRMEVTETTREVLLAATRADLWSLADADVSGVTRRCPFVEAGSTAVTWAGDVSPCLPLTRTHAEFFGDQERRIRKYLIGNLGERGLIEIWDDPDYAAFRGRVQEFEFSPCITCGGCNMTETNEDDCLSGDFPRCGACLWSHGLIRCP